LRFESADLYVIKSRQKVGCDLSRFLFGYGIGRILVATLKDVFQRAAVLGRASVSTTGGRVFVSKDFRLAIHHGTQKRTHLSIESWIVDGEEIVTEYLYANYSIAFHFRAWP
jgi:hypothetical protein